MATHEEGQALIRQFPHVGAARIAARRLRHDGMMVALFPGHHLKRVEVCLHVVEWLTEVSGMADAFARVIHLEVGSSLWDALTQGLIRNCLVV